MSESQGANDAKELYSEIVVENLSERSKGPEGQSPEQPEIENSSEMSQSQRYIKDVIQGSENHNILDKQKPVELKDVKKLTSEEREQIISNFKNGIDNEFYDVKTLKNGTTRIVKKKNKSQSLSNKLISGRKLCLQPEGQSPSGLHDRSSSKDNEQFVKPEKKYLSNEQLLMEHIFELNTQMNKLKNKQKKLKNKYKGIKRDLYVDVDENDEPHNDEKDFIQGDRNRPPSEELEKRGLRPQPEGHAVQRGWRSRVSYL